MWNCFLALSYVAVGCVLVRFGLWGTEVESLLFRMRIDHTDFSFMRNAGLGWLETEGFSRPLAWKMRLISALLWTSAVVLWPLCLPAMGSKWLSARRERNVINARLWKVRRRVSTCTKQIKFSCATGSRATGTVYFTAEDCEMALVSVTENSRRSPDQEYAQLLEWIRYYRRTDGGVTEFTDYWQHFRLPVVELVRSKRCSVECSQCTRVYPAAEIRLEEWKAFARPRGEFRGGGGAGHLLKCPEDHVVLETVTIIA